MWWALAASVASAGTASLWVGVHRDAGTTYDVAVDGADGQCSVHPARISCPASSAVTFRWGPGGDEWALYGDTVVQPGELGVGFVLAPDDQRADAIALLRSSSVDEATVRAQFLGLGEAPPPASPGMVEALVDLADHPSPLVRRAVIDALVPLWRHTASDPLPREAPPILPAGLITQISKDENFRIRRRLANRLREVRHGVHVEEALLALLDLTEDRGPVQRAAMGSLSIAARGGIAPGEVAWLRALTQVREPGPPGRAAANTLAHLSKTTAPSDVVDPVEAITRVMQYHTERGWTVWNAWRSSLPYKREWLDILLRDTVGLSSSLLKYIADTYPVQLTDALVAWEPGPPHSDRYHEARTVLAGVENAALRAALDLPPLEVESSEAEAP